MKRGFEVQACGLEQILLFTVLILAGLMPAVHSVWGDDDAPLPPLPKAPAAASDSVNDVDQIHAQVRFLSVPTELVATISDWIIDPFDQAYLAAADPFAVMHQPLRRPHTKPASNPPSEMTAGTEMRIPSTHKILNNQEAQALLSRLEEDERTEPVFSPQLAFIDGTTATAVVGVKTPFVVGWKDDLPQTRVVSQGKMIRLRTVLDDKKVWLDYEITMSRILDVTSRSIRVANHSQPITLAVPNVQTTKAGATTELPVGGTVLIGGLPAESKDGIPRELLVLLRVGRMRGIQMKKIAKPDPQEIQPKAGADAAESRPPQEKPITVRSQVTPKKRNPFSLISRILNRAPQQTAAPAKVHGAVEVNKRADPAPAPRD